MDGEKETIYASYGDVMIRKTDVIKLNKYHVNCKSLGFFFREMHILNNFPNQRFVLQSDDIINIKSLISDKDYDKYFYIGYMLPICKLCTVEKLFSMSEKVLFNCVRDILIGIKMMHNSGFLHYDIHLGNVMLKKLRPYQMTLIDFNHSIPAQSGFPHKLLSKLNLVHIPDVDRKQIGMYTDVFLFGVLMLDILTKTTVEITSSYKVKINNVIYSNILKIPFYDKTPKVEKFLIMVEKCLKVDHEDRPTIDDILKFLYDTLNVDFLEIPKVKSIEKVAINKTPDNKICYDTLNDYEDCSTIKLCSLALFQKFKDLKKSSDFEDKTLIKLSHHIIRSMTRNCQIDYELFKDENKVLNLFKDLKFCFWYDVENILSKNKKLNEEQYKKESDEIWDRYGRSLFYSEPEQSVGELRKSGSEQPRTDDDIDKSSNPGENPEENREENPGEKRGEKREEGENRDGGELSREVNSVESEKI